MRKLYKRLSKDASCKKQFVGLVVSEEMTLEKSINQKQEFPMATMFINGYGAMSYIYKDFL